MIKITLLHYIIKTTAMFAFTRFYLRVLADLNEIIRRRKLHHYFDNFYKQKSPSSREGFFSR